MTKTIRLHGFSKNDELVFTSLLSLLSNKTQYDWDVVANDDAEVVIVDIESTDDEREIDRVRSGAKSVVTYGNRSISDDFPILSKPMRAASILKCLSEISGTLEPSIAHDDDVLDAAPCIDQAYRLRRWPPPHILKSTPGAARICAILLKQVETAQQVAEQASVELEQVEAFIQQCMDEGFMVAKERTFTVASPRKKRTGLEPIFSKLRAKFGGKH